MASWGMALFEKAFARLTVSIRCAALIALLLALIATNPTPAEALGYPVTRSGDRWTPTRVEDVVISSLRVEVVPARDRQRETHVWWVDETLLLRNDGAESVSLTLAVPNAWSATAIDVAAGPDDFWAEAFVNGRRVETTLERLAVNPAHPSVTYRTGRLLSLELGPTESAHVRLAFGLPIEQAELGERGLRFPFHLRPLWGGAVEAGVILLRWSDDFYAFRANLPAYALYRDRAEWFVRAFEPSRSLDVEFLPRQAVFQMVAREIGCPTPWELMDRISEGNQEPVRAMLSSYDSAQLSLCADLPAALRGSVRAAERSGLRDLDLTQFAPPNSGISGPLVRPDPDFLEADLSERERIYDRFLRQEVSNRLED